MLVKIESNEAHLFGTPADFNVISRAIRKCRIGTTIRLPVQQSPHSSASLDISCTGTGGSIEYQGTDLLIIYPEKLRNLLSPLFSMPAETQPGSIFFISKTQVECLRQLREGSLDVVLHVM